MRPFSEMVTELCLSFSDHTHAAQRKTATRAGTVRHRGEGRRSWLERELTAAGARFARHRLEHGQRRGQLAVLASSLQAHVSNQQRQSRMNCSAACSMQRSKTLVAR